MVDASSSGVPRLAVVGLGTMGALHARDVAAYPAVELCAVVDRDKTKAHRTGAEYGVPWYEETDAMLESECPDGIIIATPHPYHRPACEAAFARGVHVLVEKPVAVDVGDAVAINDAHGAAGDVRFAIMFQQRTYGHWKRIRELVKDGALGRLIRVSWIITDWFRTQAYYDSGGWRATWKSEGGGVTMNQAPHNLDLYQWIAGRPGRITATGGFGKYHQIEVEDEITIVMEHPEGHIGHIISSTGESPGTNRLEVVGEYGRLVFEGGELKLTKTDESVLTFITNSPERITHLHAHEETISYDHHGEGGHRFVIENFADAIRDPAVELIADGREGIASLEIANGAIMAAKRGHSVSLPLDPVEYRSFLTGLGG